MWLTDYIGNPNYRALILRKNYDDLSDWIDRAKRMYKLSGAEVVGRPAEIRFPSGALFRAGYLKDRTSYEKYLGHEYQHILIEELTQIPEEKYYIQIMGSCRSTDDDMEAQMFCTTNPGGVGHLWVKERFVDPMPPNSTLTYTFEVEGCEIERTRIFIPAKVEDNPTLVEKDPGYVAYLESLKEKDPDLYRAWRMGDWDVFAGQFFGQFRRDKHVIRRMTPSMEYTHVGGIDWGWTAEFVFLASVIVPVKLSDGVTFNRVITYKEIDGTEKIPKDWAREIRGSVKINHDNFAFIRADPAMFHKQEDGSMSIADQMKSELGDADWKLKPGNNDRIGGWTTVQNWLSTAPDGLPYWLITENCTDLIRTLPALVHDDNKVEDVDTDGLDHWADAARYMLMHIKWIDAKAATIGGTIKTPKYKEALPMDKEGNLLSLDPDEFAKKQTGKRQDWRQ